MIDLPVLDGDSVREDQSGERYWRSLGQLHGDPELVADTREEFLPGASEGPGKASRRQFMQLMGASMALAGLTACRRPVEKIMPYTRQPEEIIPGLPLFYATGMPLQGVIRPILVESHEGRPTKIEGNPEHPMSMGATGVFEQASILNLYDPDRSKVVRRNGEESDWDSLLTEIRRVGLDAGAQRLAVLCEPTSSPTLLRLRSELEGTFADVRWVTYRESGDDGSVAGLRQAFGQAVRPLYRFSQAEVIVSLDGDFLGPHRSKSCVQHTGIRCRTPARRREWRNVSTLCHRERLLGNRWHGRQSSPPESDRGVGICPCAGFRTWSCRRRCCSRGAFRNTHMQLRQREVANDLRSCRWCGAGVVVPGESQPAAIHALCAAINQIHWVQRCRGDARNRRGLTSLLRLRACMRSWPTCAAGSSMHSS
jgi:MoCo/4Fe-4S cofactor protein with predicted Tat translocation signal